jgi:hypothetical protein
MTAPLLCTQCRHYEQRQRPFAPPSRWCKLRAVTIVDRVTGKESAFYDTAEWQRSDGLEWHKRFPFVRMRCGAQGRYFAPDIKLDGNADDIAALLDAAKRRVK